MLRGAVGAVRQQFAGRVSSSGRALRQLRATQCLISMNYVDAEILRDGVRFDRRRVGL